MKTMNFQQMESVNGGRTGGAGKMDSGCAWGMAGLAFGIAGFIATGGVGGLAWLAFAGMGASAGSFIDACRA